MKTTESSTSFAVAKKNRVPLTEIDVRDGATARKLGRVNAVSAGRPTRTSTFNSAL
ncbi:FxSxx-COOH cyclophane-containing RiPP peptide [Streptomyces sp. NPDC002669]|uniref:FxSxx-COOH cyclophane-containing RiPP peptide n=1 Tax=unclassified Streptomyces TaxID=2593676 RepID=UPI00368A642E